MPDRPLILFPSPERADRERKAPSFPRIVKPSFSRQFARLQQTLKRCNSASLRLLPHRRSRPLCHTFRAFRHKQDSTLVAEQTAISSIFAFFVSIYSVFVERPG